MGREFDLLFNFKTFCTIQMFCNSDEFHCNFFKTSKIWKSSVFKHKQMTPDICWGFIMCEAKSFECIISSTARHTTIKQVSPLFLFYRWQWSLEKVSALPKVTFWPLPPWYSVVLVFQPDLSMALWIELSLYPANRDGESPSSGLSQVWVVKLN